LQPVGEWEEPVAGTRRALGLFARADTCDFHSAHAVGLSGTDAARGAAAHDDDAVALDVSHDIPGKGEVVPFLCGRTALTDDAPRFGFERAIRLLGQYAAECAA
jgi:hypothetical protein